MSLCRIGTVLLITIFSTTLHAEPPTDTEVIVTASRIAETADESLASVTVIDRSDLDRAHPKDMVEVLRLVPGIDIARTGGPGSDTSVFLRGSASNHVLVLIDGVRAASATSGAFAWQHLSPAQIERIEIVRGPRAALYGSDAIGGVIQIFTRQVSKPFVRVEAGSFGTRGVQAGVGGGERVRYRISAERRRADSFSAQNSKNTFTYDPDNDGYDTTGLSAGLDADLSPSTQLSVSLWRSEDEVEFDVGKQQSINQTLQTRLTHATSADWTQTLTVGHAIDELETASDFPSYAETHRTSLDWQNDVALSANQVLSAGLSYYEDDALNIDRSSDTTVFDRSADNSALFAQYQYTGTVHDLQVALRRDRHSAFGGETTGQLGWSYRLDKITRLLASYGTAFRAPNINELYHPGYDFFGGGTYLYAGNPNLKPEQSETLEIGLRWQLSDTAQVRATLYRTDVDDLIAFEGIDAQAININSATLKGLEVEYAVRHGNWNYAGTFTFQDARDNENDTRLLRRPDNKATLRATHNVEHWNYGGEVFVSSTRDELNFNTFPTTRIRLSGYGVLNLFANYAISRELALELRLDNALDKKYELAYGFNTPERSLFVGLRYAPRD